MRRSKTILKYAFRQWPWLVAILFLTCLSSAIAALQPWPMKLLVDYALGDATTPAELRTFLSYVNVNPTATALVVLSAVASLLLFFVNSLLSFGLNLSWNISGQRMVYDLAGDLFARFQRLSLLFHSRQSVGDSLSRLTEDTWSIYSVTDGLLIAPIQQLITLVVLVSIGFALDPILAWLTIAVAPLLAASSTFFGRRMKRRAKRSREAKSRIMSFVHQTIGAIPIVQAYGTEDRNTKRFNELSKETVHLLQRGNLLASSYGLVNGLVNTAGMATVLFVGGTRVMSGAIPLGTLLVFLAYVQKMQRASGGFFKVFAKLKTAEASIDRILEIMDCEEFVTDPDQPRPLPKLEDGKRGHIRIDNVSFSYNQDTPVLTDISFEARPGQVVALVGPTGAGKSTLASLIPRFLDPWNGSVSFDGIDIRELSIKELRSQISVVLQEPFLLPLSVAENIAYGRPHATANEITNAAKAAEADAFIQDLPDGYDTILGERGSNLSGGQRQRISIARALLKNAPILILDEPTSALDAKTEASLVSAFQRLMNGRTTLIIAHRLSTIRHADRIAVLDQGRLVQFDTFRALLDQDGLFRRLYDKQFSNVIGDQFVS